MEEERLAPMMPPLTPPSSSSSSNNNDSRTKSPSISEEDEEEDVTSVESPFYSSEAEEDDVHSAVTDLTANANYKSSSDGSSKRKAATSRFGALPIRTNKSSSNKRTKFNNSNSIDNAESSLLPLTAE